MNVQIDIDEGLISKIDAVVDKLRIDRTEYFRKLATEDLVARQYSEAYGKHPQTDEEILESEEVLYGEDE
ncbi:MAG: hypothetical protein ABIU09_04830 [Pyrinomonadaceae bacterium]